MAPELIELHFDKHPNQYISLFINNAESIQVTCAKKHRFDSFHSNLVHYMAVDGSPTNYSMFSFKTGLDIYRQMSGNLYNIIQEIRDSIGFDPKAIGPLFELKRRVDRYIMITFSNPDFIEPDYVPVFASTR